MPTPNGKLRAGSAIRSCIIAYGVAAYAFFYSQSSAIQEQAAPAASGNFLYMLIAGIAVQLLMLLVRGLLSSRGGTPESPGYFSPLAVFMFDLAVDAATVLLFALATYRGIAQYAVNI